MINYHFFEKKIFWEYTSLKTLETDLEIYFVDHILDAMIKRTPVGFICILGN